MRAKSMELMDQIISFIDQFYSAKHTSPSANEIAQGVGIGVLSLFSRFSVGVLSLFRTSDADL